MTNNELILKIKNDIKNKHAENLEKLEKDLINGIDVVRLNSQMVDDVIIKLFDAAKKDFPNVTELLEQMAVVAVGGYGRRELAPFSDIDILFLMADEYNPDCQKLAEFVLYSLWDCGFKIGQSFRSIKQCIEDAGNDMVFRTNLLENRLILGNNDLLEDLNFQYNQKIVSVSHTQFLKAKLNERKSRLEKTGYSRYLLEPDIKEGQGALRDLHIIFWLTKYIFGVTEIDELVEKNVMSKAMIVMFVKAHVFFSAIRCFLHYYAKRADNRLTFDMQQTIASVMGFKDSKNSSSVEKFMKAYYLHTKVISDLTRMVCAIIEDKNTIVHSDNKKVEGFIVNNSRIDFISRKDLNKNPIKIIKIFYLAHKKDYKISPKALQVITENLPIVFSLQNNNDANQYFLDILTSKKNSEQIIRTMSEVGVLGRFIPDFAKIIAQMQFDMYHIYTTDEHTIRAIGILNNIEQGERIFKSDQNEESLKHVRNAAAKIHFRIPLYVAMFLHDIAKGRGGDHSENGAKISLKIAPRMGLNDSDTKNVSWLIKNHQVMSQTAFQRDVFDIKTIIDFVEIVKSPERLKQLYVLTSADIIAVGPDIWTSWKSRLLYELYKRAEEYMQGVSFSEKEDARVTFVKDNLKSKLSSILNNSEINEYLAHANSSYWLGYEEKDFLLHANLIKRTEDAKENLGVEFANNKKRNLIDIIVYTADKKALFSKIAGALSISGFSIIDAKIMTMTNGMVLDSFSVEDFFVYDANVQEIDDIKKAKITENIRKAINDEFKIDSEIRRKYKNFADKKKALKKDTHVIIDNDASKTHTVIEIDAGDCFGFLHYMTNALSEQDLQVSSAHIFTYGDRVVDVFYVKDQFGMKIDHSQRLEQIKQFLFKVLDSL